MPDKIPEIGLLIQVSDSESFLIKKDPNGYPDILLVSYNHSPEVSLTKTKKETAALLYEKLTGRPYPHPHATTRQVLWDFLEVAIGSLP